MTEAVPVKDETKPCRNGHTSGRYDSGKCKTCQTLATQSWRKRNKGRVRKHGQDWYAQNKQRHNEQNQRWRTKNPEKVRQIVWKREKMPFPTRPRPSVCECCGGPPGRVALNLDHDHETGKFRGWLCMKCNTAIGKLGDNLAGLLRAVRYLERK